MYVPFLFQDYPNAASLSPLPAGFADLPHSGKVAKESGETTDLNFNRMNPKPRGVNSPYKGTRHTSSLIGSGMKHVPVIFACQEHGQRGPEFHWPDPIREAGHGGNAFYLQFPH